MSTRQIAAGIKQTVVKGGEVKKILGYDFFTKRRRDAKFYKRRVRNCQVARRFSKGEELKDMAAEFGVSVQTIREWIATIVLETNRFLRKGFNKNIRYNDEFMGAVDRMHRHYEVMVEIHKQGLIPVEQITSMLKRYFDDCRAAKEQRLRGDDQPMVLRLPNGDGSATTNSS